MAMRARLGRLWDASQVRSESSESKGRSGVASKSSPIKLVVALFVALLVLVFFISNSTVSVTLDFVFFLFLFRFRFKNCGSCLKDFSGRSPQFVVLFWLEKGISLLFYVHIVRSHFSFNYRNI